MHVSQTISVNLSPAISHEMDDVDNTRHVTDARLELSGSSDQSLLVIRTAAHWQLTPTDSRAERVVQGEESWTIFNFMPGLSQCMSLHVNI